MTDMQRLFLTELRLCGESNHWRVEVRYTGELKGGESGKDGAGDDSGDSEKKKSSSPEEVNLSILVPAGDRSVVDLQIDAMDRAIAMLQATASAARAEQARHTDGAGKSG